MKIEVSFAHLHNTLFFAGRNWGEKLDTRNTTKGKIELTYDRTEKELCVKHANEETYIPSSNVVSYCPMNKPPVMVTPTSGKGANPKITAQVSGPHDHVFAGEGKGQTGQSGKIK